MSIGFIKPNHGWLEVTKSNCRCKANCVKPFRDPATLTAVRAERLKLLQMEKQAADREAGQSQGHFIRAGCCEVVVCTRSGNECQVSGIRTEMKADRNMKFFLVIYC